MRVFSQGEKAEMCKRTPPLVFWGLMRRSEGLARADSSPDPSSARARPFKDRTVFFEPRGAWKMLADTGFGRGNTKQPALRADRIVAPKTRLELMRCLLDKVRNYFEQNPND